MFLLVFCMRRSFVGELVPLDLEVEATCQRNRAERRQKILQNRTVVSILADESQSSESSSSYSPSLRESATNLPEAIIMANEQPGRVTLEDYSSSSVPLFFINIA